MVLDIDFDYPKGYSVNVFDVCFLGIGFLQIVYCYQSLSATCSWTYLKFMLL